VLVIRRLDQSVQEHAMRRVGGRQHHVNDHPKCMCKVQTQ
jgi:hypothetical protein